MARTSTARQGTALQRTPDGAAELGRAEHRQRRRHGPCGRKARAAGRIAACLRHQSQALRAGLGDKARRAFSPPVLGRRYGVNCFAIQHNGLLRARPAFRSPSSLPPGVRATPVMSCAHSAPARGIGSEYRAHAPPIPMLVRTRGTGCARLMVRRAARAVMELAPARPPSAPRGGSLALSTVLASVAPCSPRQGQALRARGCARP
jgi:hypothetical protein